MKKQVIRRDVILPDTEAQEQLDNQVPQRDFQEDVKSLQKDINNLMEWNEKLKKRIAALESCS